MNNLKLFLYRYSSSVSWSFFSLLSFSRFFPWLVQVWYHIKRHELLQKSSWNRDMGWSQTRPFFHRRVIVARVVREEERERVLVYLEAVYDMCAVHARAVHARLHWTGTTHVTVHLVRLKSMWAAICNGAIIYYWLGFVVVPWFEE